MGEAKEKAKKRNSTRYLEVPEDVNVEELKMIMPTETEPAITMSYEDWYLHSVRHHLPNETDAEWAIIDELDTKLKGVVGGDRVEYTEAAHLAFVQARPQVQGLIYQVFTPYYSASARAKTVKPNDWDETAEPADEQPAPEEAN